MSVPGAKPTVELDSPTPLLGLRDTPLSVDEVVAAVSDPTCGAVAVFLGVVRNHDGGQQVAELDYEAHPSALDALATVAAEVAAASGAAKVAAVHRVGSLAIGDLAVVVAASAPHRAEAFDACRALIDTLKARVPIWKHQSYADGATSWVGLP